MTEQGTRKGMVRRGGAGQSTARKAPEAESRERRIIIDLAQRIEKREQSDSEKFLPGDRVINTVNTPEEQVWNGTTGTVHAVDDDGEVFVKLDVPVKDAAGEFKEIVKFTKAMVKNLRYAYALTVHKSQGSQYRKVVMTVLARDTFQLDRSLVYTGVTRTKTECVIIGDYNTFAQSIQKTRKKDTVMQCLAIENANINPYSEAQA